MSSSAMSSSSRASRASSTTASPDPLARLARRGSDILPHHLEAVGRFRVAWDRRDEREVRRALNAIGPTFTPMLLAIMLKRIDVATWCRVQEPRPDPKKMLGVLIGILDRLAESYGITLARCR